MLWIITVVLIVLWLLGLNTQFADDSFIHVLFAAAVALLVVSLGEEVTVNRKLRRTLRGQGRGVLDQRKQERLTLRG
jgi:hypothetical protein